MINSKAAGLTRQALCLLDQAGLGSSPAACHLQSALTALGHEASATELEDLIVGLFPLAWAA
jgi:hypothetical protein